MNRAEAIKELQSYADNSWGGLNEAFEMAIAALRERETVTNCNGLEWISVQERLPEQFQSVLSYRGNKVLFEVDFIDEQGKWYSQCKYSTTKVTHWMPLPEPPKEGA